METLKIQKNPLKDVHRKRVIHQMQCMELHDRFTLSKNSTVWMEEEIEYFLQVTKENIFNNHSWQQTK